jgi:integrase
MLPTGDFCGGVQNLKAFQGSRTRLKTNQVKRFTNLGTGESKNREGREFPFTLDLREVLERQREFVHSIERGTGQIIPWVFVQPQGRPLGEFRDSWKKACRLAGLPAKLIHDFRRTAVRNLERAGVPRSAAMKMTGHLTESVYRRYAIVDQAMLQDAAVKLAALHAADAAARK